jgi:hypothetical protein
VALVWGEHRGWAMGVETGSGEDLVIVSWYGPALLPGPAEVARFVRAAGCSGVVITNAAEYSGVRPADGGIPESAVRTGMGCAIRLPVRWPASAAPAFSSVGSTLWSPWQYEREQRCGETDRPKPSLAP